MLRVALALALVLIAGMARATPISFEDLLRRPRPTADHRIAYGAAPEQFGELWLPKAAGRRPIVVLLHGGCWLGDLPGLELMDYVADDLRRRGFAVWNIEYRRLGQPGGGYPGTFEDTSAGLDHLRAMARTYPLDLAHVVLVGHSAGGQLALWAAARRRLPMASPLAGPNPLWVTGVISLAGILDLESYRAQGPSACGGPGAIDQLVGAGHRPAAELYADTSPAALLPLGVRQMVFSGDLDPIVPKAFGQAYAAKAAAAGDAAQGMVLPNAGHFELIDPTSAAWPTIVKAIEQMSR